mmetsp:Transcript_9520/g.28992  ORF Transcript_9520/g.28992 Transcript_9520/m.28992 type:complete len:217 (-) Transcript_9520:635-1285(-)
MDRLVQPKENIKEQGFPAKHRPCYHPQGVGVIPHLGSQRRRATGPFRPASRRRARSYLTLSSLPAVQADDHGATLASSSAGVFFRGGVCILGHPLNCNHRVEGGAHLSHPRLAELLHRGDLAFDPRGLPLEPGVLERLITRDAFRGIDREHARDEVLCRVGYGIPIRAEELVLTPLDLLVELRVIVGVKGREPAEEDVDDDAERPYVARLGVPLHP